MTSRIRADRSGLPKATTRRGTILTNSAEVFLSGFNRSQNEPPARPAAYLTNRSRDEPSTQRAGHTTSRPRNQLLTRQAVCLTRRLLSELST
jgi:hypothetical protein